MLRVLDQYPWRLIYHFAVREFRQRLSNSFLGIVWLVFLPLALLGVYGFVFGFIFQSRAPSGFDYPFVVWLGLGLWPWLAFSESVLRASQAIRENSALISKLPLPRSIFVLSTESVPFVMHMIGYVVVLIAFDLWKVDITWIGAPYAILIMVCLAFLSLGIGLGLATLVIFFRDLEQVLPVLFMLWFFLTPILYSPELLPPDAEIWLLINPLALALEELKRALLFGQILPNSSFVALFSVSVCCLMLGGWLFGRLSPYFEDYL